MDIFAPIEQLATLTTSRILRIPLNSYWGEAIHYFIYDVVKIGLLLVVINLLMAVVRYYFPTTKVRHLLLSRRWFGLDYLLAALLGVVTPFCSCSSIPLFIGFISAGIPLGVTLAFLIASPLVNEASLYLFPSVFGLSTTLIYNLLGIMVAVIGGMVLQKLNLEQYIVQDLLPHQPTKKDSPKEKVIPLNQLIPQFFAEGMQITRQVFPYVVLGVAIGALIHGFVPTALVEHYLATKAWWTVPLAVVLGAPLYANSVSVIPIMEALVGKGVPIGTALAFMTSIVTVSLPEILILRRVMKWPLLAAFISITVVGIMAIGFILNLL